ncbi:Uncharacterized protein PECH_001219 [Penicillium ucsense]|uniref:Aminoglycoside phosphotransferase domain-containing protein n=1 Tax=Penicillium ucsense TaxID=2839758 RepID=A0A8J8WNC3_9EURO|nr:Uncharacterized protein PECM_000020 [Penicillium ucsense]KAF7733066.1 Uncharacterized protein PECH_001219 [Penicillium ucsense]
MSPLLDGVLNTQTYESAQLNAVISSLFPSSVRVQQSENINGHLHGLRRLTLTNGLRLFLKSSPYPGTPLLRHERLCLETEARVLALLGQSANPCIPRLYHYRPSGSTLGPSLLLRQYMEGSSLLEIEGLLNTRERSEVDRHLGFLAMTIGQNVAPKFGSMQQVAQGAGKTSWRDAFCALLEGVLRDAEDVFINLPYAELRHEILRLAPALDEVILPRLTIVSLGRPAHVLLNEQSNQISGVVDLSSACWGDMLMAEIFERPTFAVIEGAGLPLVRTKRESIRVLL